MPNDIDDPPLIDSCLFFLHVMSQLDILRHDCHALSMDHAPLGIFEEMDQVGFGSLLQHTHSKTLPMPWFSLVHILCDVLCELHDQPVEW